MADRDEARRAYEKQWRQANKERLAAQNKKWREDNAVELKAKKRAYYARTKDEANTRRRQDRIDNPEKYKTIDRRASSTKKNRTKNWFTDGLFEERLEEQGGLCAICLTPFSMLPPNAMHGDHCHALEIPRGVLCGHCNAGLGQFKDSPYMLLNAVAYLKKYSEVDEL
jgi:hypothetical protein